MRSLVQSFPGQLRRSPLAASAFLLLAGVSAYKTSMYLLNGDLVGLAYVGIAYGIGAAVVTILRDWRNGLFLFLAWFFFEDLGRKFFRNNIAIFFPKKVL